MMNLTKNLPQILALLLIGCSNPTSQTKKASSGGYTYEYVKDDPTQTRIYIGQRIESVSL